MAGVGLWLTAVLRWPLCTGLTSALALVPIDSLLTTGYGRVLIIKAALLPASSRPGQQTVRAR